jgi:hypothetical protein
MNPSNPSSRRRQNARLAPEILESRELLTGGAGDTFAIIPGTIAKANEPAAIKFTIDPAHFVIPKGVFTLGVDVVAQSGSSLKPLISSVNGPNGAIVPQTFHSVYAPHLPNSKVAGGQATSAVLTPIHLDPGHPKDPVTYTVKIKGESGTTGQFLLGFYLPGDAQGNGQVTQADVTAVKGALGVKAGNPKYSFDADVNRDGRIGRIDLSYTQQNLGVITNITPVVSANLDPASVTTMTDRVTTLKTVHFSGFATPGASIKYQEVNNKSQPVATTADSKGNYSIQVPLGDGSNTFRVTTQDAFGQSISGTIAPVTLMTSAPVTAQSIPTLIQQSNGTKA